MSVDSPRRRFTNLLSVAGLGQILASSTRAQTPPATKPAGPDNAPADQQHDQTMDKYAALTGGPKLTIGMLVYPGMFLQDLVGPLAVFEALMNREIHLLWKNTDSVGSENPKHPALIPVRPTTRFADCPAQLDVLFVPGGVPGTLTMMEDREVLAFLARQAQSSRFVTSVCTGSLILGAAGLLKGYKATTYWAVQEVLKDYGAIPTLGRVVRDRNRITGGGVTAGIDFGLEIAAVLRGEDYAKAVQLYLEYDPAPPFDSGSPAKASPLLVKFLREMFDGVRSAASAIAKRSKI